MPKIQFRYFGNLEHLATCLHNDIQKQIEFSSWMITKSDVIFSIV